MRVETLITGGGTGGHLYPALSVVPFLLQHLPGDPIETLEGGRDRRQKGSERLNGRNEPRVLYVGSSRGLERLVLPRTGIRFFLFPQAPPTSFLNVILLAVAGLRSLLLVARWRPRVTFATGGYVSVPAAVASWLLRVPLVVFLPDAVPGKAVRLLLPLAKRIAVSNEDAAAGLDPCRTVVTGYPVREWFGKASRESGRHRFRLPADARVLGVFGGSQGSRSINDAVIKYLPEMLSRSHVLHVCGRGRLEEVQRVADSLSPGQRKRYSLHAYLHDEEMADALAAVDLAVCRSGASVLGELPAAGTPAVLVPYPNPAVHQGENAEYLVRHGAAIVIRDGDLQSQLGPIVEELLSDSEHLREMAAACRSLAKPDAVSAIGNLILGARR